MRNAFASIYWSAEGGARSSLLYGGEGVSQSPCFWWVNEKRLRLHIAGSTLPHPRPTSSSSGWRPSITARHFSSCPSDSASRRTPCPPGIAERWLQVRLGCVRLSSSCPFRLFHTFPLFPADEELPPPLDTALLIR